MLLELKDLRIDYGAHPAVEGLNLSVDRGEIVTVVGPNGAGKSSTLRCICGLIRPTSGEVRLGGTRIDGLSTQAIVKRGLSLVPEHRHIFPSMTVLENLMMGAYLRKDHSGIKSDLKETYRHFPILEERSAQLGSKLSGGEQQMLAIGRALMSKPSILLLDEPSLGLAPLIVLEVAKITADICRSGVSIVLIEQNANMALRVAHRGYVMEMGRVVMEGDAQVLLESENLKATYLGG